ncbi:MAG: hypothetical protein HY758_11625 [Nitrospirae bacterium]|nr:hypothetical protein [Nitrospirota bacterium]
MLKQIRNRLPVIIMALLLSAVPVSGIAKTQGAFLYKLSNFTGPIPYSWVRLSIDRERSELYVIGMSEVKVFNDKGVEIYSFGDDGSLDGILDVAVDKAGDILVLSIKDDNYKILRCNYRGELKSVIEIKNLPPEFSKFSPNLIRYREGRIYLIDAPANRIAVTDESGVFVDGYDINALLELEEKDRYSKQMAGFDIDSDGNMLFTVPTMFRAFVLSPDHKLRSFGQAGNLPGKFSVVAGITKDDTGNYIVIDTLKCAVMVFNKDFEFVSEFGDRSLAADGLIAPKDTVMLKDKIYISQSRKRGVSVFKLTTGQKQGGA